MFLSKQNVYVSVKGQAYTMNPNGKLISLSFQPVELFGSISAPVSESVGWRPSLW